MQPGYRMSSMDMNLPGTPIAIDIEKQDDLYSLDASSSRGNRSSSSRKLPHAPKSLYSDNSPFDIKSISNSLNLNQSPTADLSAADISPRLPEPQLPELPNLPKSEVLDHKQRIYDATLERNHHSRGLPERQRDIYSRGSSSILSNSNVSLRSQTYSITQSDDNLKVTASRSGNSIINGAIAYDDCEITETSAVNHPFTLPTNSEFHSAASYHVTTLSVPKRPKTANRPKTTAPKSQRKEKSKLTSQSIPNLRNSLSSLPFLSNDARKSASTSSSASSSTGSRAASRRSSTLSRIASALLTKLPETSELPGAWVDDKKSTDSRPGTSASKASSLGSAVSASDLDSPLDSNEDLNWRVKLRPNCFLPQLNEKYMCPACNNVLYYPVQLSNCDHNVCSTCLTSIMRGVRTCPVDKRPIDRSQVIVPREFSVELSSKSLACPQNDLGCQWTGTYGNFKSHHLSCEYADVACPSGCGLRCERRRVDDHAMKECSLRMVTCEFCTRAIRAEKEIDHLKQCVRFPVSCPNSCGLKEIPREELPKHIEEKCPYGEIKCPFQRMGCYVVGTRDFIRNHMKDELTGHVEMLCLSLNINSDKLLEHDDRISRQRMRIEENEFQTSNLLRRQGCQFLWKIDDWSQRTVDAAAGRKTIIKSPPFYTGRYGYKLGLTLMPNGDGAAKSTDLSIYVCVCKGEYDALQTWPFSMSVTFTLVDQCQDPRAKVDHSYVLRPNPCKENIPFLGRPTTNANPSIGAQYFAPLDMLATRDYVRDDVVFIKILAETDS